MSLSHLTMEPESTHLGYPSGLTGNVIPPRSGTPLSPGNLTMVPVCTPKIGRQAAPMLALRAINLYLTFLLCI